jgi:HAMP domain-containing protein
MRENFLSRAKADGKVFVRIVGLMAKLSRLKLDIRAKQQQMSRLFKYVGKEIWEIYHENKTARNKITSIDSIVQELDEIERLKQEVAQLTDQMEQARKEFRGETPPAQN